MNFLKNSKIKYLLIAISAGIAIFLASYLNLIPIKKYLTTTNHTTVKSIIIHEKFLTKEDVATNVDSPAVWHGQDNQNWLLVTAKSIHKILIYDAQTGEKIKEFGEFGSEKLQFARPNGIAIIDNLAFIVERDNHRVQVFSLPFLKFVGFFGEKDLQKPYGITWYKIEPNKLIVYITDSYKTDKVEEMDKKVRQYQISIKNNKLSSELVNSFGYEKNIQTLYKVESILNDPQYNRLFIADENKKERSIKIYTLDGKFSGECLRKVTFKGDPEGIAMYETSNDNGYLVVTDQTYTQNTFHIFDRKTLQHLVAFSGAQTSNTDGIAITTKNFGSFKKGAFYVINNDRNVAAFDWEEIEKILTLAKKS